jgi:O-succinylbenzoate synthase
MAFSQAERQSLLAQKFVGETVVARLEQLGYSSFAALCQADPDDITRSIAAMMGSTCWHNSPQAKAAIRNCLTVAAKLSPQ